MMRPILTVLLFAATALPAAAEVTITHNVEGRFGVSYVSGGNGTSQTQPLYEGIYTTTFAHDFDNGMRFRFELGISAGNFDSDRRGPRSTYPARPAAN